MEILEKIIELSDEYEDEAIRLRRKIHENPELSNEEYETSKLVEDYLIELGIDVKRVGETGVLGTIEGSTKGKTLLLRADMDALPIEEENDLKFKSKNTGIMHACGHDVHTANLLVVAKILNKVKLDFNGTIKLIFQPAEEEGGGAKDTIDFGILENPTVDAAMALHIMPTRKGDIQIGSKSISAYSDDFKIVVHGKEAHTRSPEEGIDAINIASHIVVALNSIMSKNINPLDRATFSIGKIEGGTASNIVPDKVRLEGMIRSLDSKARTSMIEKLEKLTRGIAESFGGSAEFIFKEGYPSVYNDEDLTEKTSDLFKRNANDIYKGLDIKDPKKSIFTDLNPVMASEDFGFFSQEVPTLFYMVGTGDYAPGHSSKFFVDEDYIKLCTRTMLVAAIEYLKDIEK